jgi:hypothetical protein
MKSPALCPCCGLSCHQCLFKQTRKLVPFHEDEGVELWCQFCNTWFMWQESTGVAIVTETPFLRGYRGNKGEIVGKPQKIIATAEWNPETQQRGPEELYWGYE